MPRAPEGMGTHFLEAERMSEDSPYLNDGTPKEATDAELEDMVRRMRTNIRIFGMGGGGSNTVARIFSEGVAGADLYACNTDAQHLLAIRAPHKILLGRRSTKGLGAGALPQIGEEAATVITVPNDKLLDLVPRMNLQSAFKFADEVLMRAIKGLTEMITKPGIVNLDFNDVRTVMRGGGVAMIGMGESQAVGDDRAIAAVEEAINSPLLEVDVSTAKGVLVSVTGGNDMTLSEAERTIEMLQERVTADARIIWGARVDPTLEHTLRVMLVATGVRSKQITGRVAGKPDPRRPDIVR